MLFQASIDIPKNTASSNPTIVAFKIAHGIITKFMVRPHSGHSGLAHLVILHHEHQIAPSTENMSLYGDAYPLDWEEYYESYQPPYELKLKGWNFDDTYQHSFDVFVIILPRKAIATPSITDSIKDVFSMLLPKRIFTGSE